MYFMTYRFDYINTLMYVCMYSTFVTGHYEYNTVIFNIVILIIFNVTYLITITMHIITRTITKKVNKTLMYHYNYYSL